MPRIAGADEIDPASAHPPRQKLHLVCVTTGEHRSIRPLRCPVSEQEGDFNAMARHERRVGRRPIEPIRPRLAAPLCNPRRKQPRRTQKAPIGQKIGEPIHRSALRTSAAIRLNCREISSRERDEIGEASLVERSHGFISSEEAMHLFAGSTDQNLLTGAAVGNAVEIGRWAQRFGKHRCKRQVSRRRASRRRG